MINVLDKFYCSSEQVEHKSLLGYLRYYNNKGIDLPINLVEDTQQPTLIFVHTNTVHHVPMQEVQEIVAYYKKHKSNKIVIDTCIEEFVDDKYYMLIDRLEALDVDPLDIVVFTGQNSIENFITDYNIKHTCFSCQGFELMYNIYIELLLDLKGTPHQTPGLDFIYRPITPRKLKKHFISYKKNGRRLRKLFHVIMYKKGLIDKSYYSWHATKDFTEHDIKFLDYFKYLDEGVTVENHKEKFKEYNKKILPNSIEGSLEWSFEDDVILHGGINLPHETHVSLDFWQPESLHTSDRIFFTEKTYKNFVYGMPFINLGIPRAELVLQQMGYRGFDDLFGMKKDPHNYYKNVEQSIELLDTIGNMPLQELEDILNSETCMDRLRHNQEVFKEQRQFKKLLVDLESICDKY